MPMLLQIQGYHLPGPAWQSDDAHYDNVHVGIQLGKEPRELVRADSHTSSWTIPIEVVAREGGLDFRGAAVQGLPAARFVYLTWGDVAEDAPSRCSAGPNSCSPTSNHSSRAPATPGRSSHAWISPTSAAGRDVPGSRRPH
jgi:Family of unknown function (DUF5990)